MEQVPFNPSVVALTGGTAVGLTLSGCTILASTLSGNTILNSTSSGGTHVGGTFSGNTIIGPTISGGTSVGMTLSGVAIVGTSTFSGTTITCSGFTSDGNISQTGATTLGTGTGAISINGTATVASGKSLVVAGGTLSVTQTSNTSAVYAQNLTRTMSAPEASAVYRSMNVAMTDSGTASTTHFSQGFYNLFTIDSSGSNAGYDRGANFICNVTGSGGTRAEVTGLYVQVGTGGSSTDTITALYGARITALKTAGSTVTTSTLLYLDANIGSTKYAIDASSSAGIVRIGDTTDSTSTTTGSFVTAGGAGFGKYLTLDGGSGKTLRYTNGTANASVATTLGSVGPTGSTAGDPQGWLRVSINGTDRYIPYW